MKVKENRVDPGELLPKEQVERIQMAIKKLPQKLKDTVMAKDFLMLSYKDISRLMKVPIGTVKSRLNRGRFEVQYILKQKNLEEKEAEF